VIKPTVGRVVLYVPLVSHCDEVYSIVEGREHAAQIAFVHSDRMVNIGVIDANGKHFNKTSVPLVQPEDPTPANTDYCKWMDYQIGQAAKAV